MTMRIDNETASTCEVEGILFECPGGWGRDPTRKSASGLVSEATATEEEQPSGRSPIDRRISVRFQELAASLTPRH